MTTTQVFELLIGLCRVIERVHETGNMVAPFEAENLVFGYGGNADTETKTKTKIRSVGLRDVYAASNPGPGAVRSEIESVLNIIEIFGERTPEPWIFQEARISLDTAVSVRDLGLGLRCRFLLSDVVFSSSSSSSDAEIKTPPPPPQEKIVFVGNRSRASPRLKKGG